MILSGPGFFASQRVVKVPSRRRLSIQAAYNLAAVAKIVLIEDDVEIRRLVARALSEQGHDVESAAMAMEGLQLTVKGAPDLVVMDLGLPDLDGTELLRMIRSVSEVPIIIITARGADDVVVKTLDAGADDYLTKPFSLTQLEARVRAVLRRRLAADTDGPIQVGDLMLDAVSREATLAGDQLELSPKEFDLLHALAARPGEVVSKRELLAEVWREPYGGSERTVDVHLSWLRSKLGESAQEPHFLHTVHGVGVKLVDPSG
jgi:DNA-binding response OmpR family regulator